MTAPAGEGVGQLRVLRAKRFPRQRNRWVKLSEIFSHDPDDLIPSQRISHHEGILQPLCKGTHAAPFPQDCFL